MSDWFEKLFINEVKASLKHNNITITDQATGKQYEVYVLDGKLMMKEQGE